MAKNTGKPSEKEFENAWATLGKRAWLYRVVDAAEVKGRTGSAQNIRVAPSDYLVTSQGTHYAEVKSTENATSFPFSLLRTKQSATATMILAAGGDYFVYAHSLVLKKWFRIPYGTIQQVKARGKSSIKWTDLQGLEWTLPNTTT